VRRICKTLGATIDTPSSSPKPKLTLEGERYEEPASDSNEVRIYWKDTADFEVVDKWPSKVYHDTMGLLTGQSRYVAPRIKDIITKPKVLSETNLLSQSREWGEESEFQANVDDEVGNHSTGAGPADRGVATVTKDGETKMGTESDYQEEENNQSSWWKKLPGFSRLKRRSSS